MAEVYTGFKSVDTQLDGKNHIFHNQLNKYVLYLTTKTKTTHTRRAYFVSKSGNHIY